MLDLAIRRISASGHKREFSNCRQNVRFWGKNGHFLGCAKESANSQKRTSCGRQKRSETDHLTAEVDLISVTRPSAVAPYPLHPFYLFLWLVGHMLSPPPLTRTATAERTREE